MSLNTVAGATPWIVVEVTHLAYWPDVGVPLLETLPPPTAVALACPGVEKSQVIDAVLVSTRSAVSVASEAAVTYSAVVGAPPPPPPPAAAMASATYFASTAPIATRADKGSRAASNLFLNGTAPGGCRADDHH